MAKATAGGQERVAGAFSAAGHGLGGQLVGLRGAVGVIIVWALLGPVFHFSDTWQLVINTGTTIVTFLMVFLIQRSQNKDSLAIQLKLNEIVAALQGASNRLINVEDLTEQEVRDAPPALPEAGGARQARDSTLTASHSVEEAETRAARKRPS